MQRPTLRELRESDLPAVTGVHLAAFPDSLLTKLGPEVVTRYYAWQLSAGNQAHGTGLFEDGILLGFSIGGKFLDSLNGFFRANRPVIAVAVIRRPWLLLSPLFWNRFEMTLGSLGRARKKKRRAMALARSGAPATAPQQRPKPYIVLSIATHPDHQRKGVGKRLLSEQEATAQRLGYELIRLSVHADNEAAIAFYESQGWSKLEDGNGWNGRMVKAL